MNDDLDKAEQQWANRSLFRPQRRRRARWLWLVVMIGVAVIAVKYAEQLKVLLQ